MSGDLTRADDAELLERIGRLDVDALSEIYRRHAAGVFVVAHQLMGPVRAQEATKEVFLYVWDHADQLAGHAQRLRPVLLDQLRLRHLAQDRSHGPAEEQNLTEEERAALALALEGLGYREAAAHLGLPPEVVDGLLRTALLKIYEVRAATTEDPRAH